jgi:transposase InsO family protein
VGRVRAADPARTWPGQVFEDPETAYGAAMREFVRKSAPRPPARPTRRPRPQTEEPAARRTPRQQQRHLDQQRAQALQRRQQEDTAWEAACRERRAWLRPERWTPSYGRAYLAAEGQWLRQWDQRQATLAHREQEEAQWYAEQERLQAALAPPAAKPPWVALLALTDNCTRQCVGRPLFAVGPKVTAADVIAALRALLPAPLQFLISDRGTHFTAREFAQFAHEEDFIHVRIARHRPQSNGIAERFVRTLKEWLAAHAWDGVEALGRLPAQFRAQYNDRPHQGLPLPGLSPKEFAARVWLL